MLNQRYATNLFSELVVFWVLRCLGNLQGNHISPWNQSEENSQNMKLKLHV